MRAILLISCAALSLAACGRSDNEAANADLNATATDNMMVDQNAAMTGTGGMDSNTATNGATEQNMAMNDMTHNDADTNVANGM